MPIPEYPSHPGRLPVLSDTVLERMLVAMLDGTLKPGERLDTSDLMAWLKVSRPVIRGVVDRLTEWGLLEVAASRYTRVATIDRGIEEHAFRFLTAMYDTAITWMADMSPAARTSIEVLHRSARREIAENRPSGILKLLDAYGELVGQTQNTFLIQAERPARILVKFIIRNSTREPVWFDVKRSEATLAAVLGLPVA